MTALRDYHVHTTFSDGVNTPEEMVCAAIEKGLVEIGFSEHSYTPFDEECCMSPGQTAAYKDTVRELKQKYRDRIAIYCGIEQDYWSETGTEDYDYVIGSVHYVRTGDRYLSVDETLEIQKNAVEEFFGGDYYAFAEAYYETVADVARKTNADIIGHFDLVAKYNQQAHLFDEQNPRYVAAWKKAADRLLAFEKPFEINTGAISRGYRTVAYPAPEIMAYIRENGGKFILSSDSHRAETLCFGFDQFQIAGL